MTHSTHISIKMSRYKEFEIKTFFKELYYNYIPTKRDNLKQVIVKLLFMLLVVAIVISGIYFGVYYCETHKQESVLNSSREIFEKYDYNTAFKLLSNQNEDYVGWLKFGNTKLNNPVYKAKNNKFYLDRNGLKKNSSYGSVFMDYRFENQDKNIVIYGNNLKNGSMFGQLENLRNLNYYNKNSVLQFTDWVGTHNYKIYAIFVLNAKVKDDGGYIYNIYRKDFFDNTDFDGWVDEAKQRSIINTNIDVSIEDNVLTLVTSCDDFPNARLVVMARSEREGENIYFSNFAANINQNPLYPKKWYEVRGIEGQDIGTLS